MFFKVRKIVGLAVLRGRKDSSSRQSNPSLLYYNVSVSTAHNLFKTCPAVNVLHLSISLQLVISGNRSIINVTAADGGHRSGHQTDYAYVIRCAVGNTQPRSPVITHSQARIAEWYRNFWPVRHNCGTGKCKHIIWWRIIISFAVDPAISLAVTRSQPRCRCRWRDLRTYDCWVSFPWRVPGLYVKGPSKGYSKTLL